jgi:hypothetical protein
MIRIDCDVCYRSIDKDDDSSFQAFTMYGDNGEPETTFHVCMKCLISRHDFVFSIKNKTRFFVPPTSKEPQNV